MARLRVSVRSKWTGARQWVPVRSSAQSVVEFALVIPLFLLIVVGTIDVARVFIAASSLAAVTREAARYGAVHYGENNWEQAAIATGTQFAFGIDRAALRLAVVGESPASVRVDGEADVYAITPMVGALLGQPFTLRASTRELAG